MRYLLCLLLLSAQWSFCQQVATTEDELQHLADLSLLPLYRPGTSMHQISSYDRQGGNDDGFSGKYSFIKRNADSSLLMFEAVGPGVINRIWTPTPTDDTLDIYLDDTIVSVKYTDLFSGKISPFVSPTCGQALGGYYNYYPLLFQKSARIISRGKKLQFHQVQWRSYPAGTIVKRTWRPFKPPAIALVDPLTTSVNVKPQTATVLYRKSSGGRVNGFKLFPASAFQGPYKSIWLKINYDNEATPAVYAPASDFFGYAFEKPSMNGYVAGVFNDTAYCYLPMPFDNSFEISVDNKSEKAFAIDVAIGVTDTKRNAATEGKLFTLYNQQIHKTNDGVHELLHAGGRGHYVGTILLCQGTVPGMTLFFEGDDSTVVDGKLTMHGTGSEDYFNGGWYAFPDRWDDAQSLPFPGSLEYNLPACRTGAYRFFLADKIPFEKSIHHSIEHGPVSNNIPAIYTSLAFYYGESGVKQPAVKYVEVYMPDTLMLYPQLTDVNIWNAVDVKSLWAHDTGGMSYLYTVNNETALRFSLDNIPDGRYELFADFDKLPTGADVRILQRQTLLKDWFATSFADTSRVKNMLIGSLIKDSFLKTFTLEFKTSVNKNQFFLNRFMLVRKK